MNRKRFGRMRLFFLFILIMLNTSCTITIPRTKLLNIPFFSQGSIPWCGPACIKMWAEYQNLHPTMEEIANAICGPQGSSMYWVSRGVTWFTNSTGVYVELGETQLEQDQCIASCFASLLKDHPAVIHFNRNGSSDHHAIILRGAEYHYQLWPLKQDPVIDVICFHDPGTSVGDQELPIHLLKQSYYKPFQNKYMAVVGYPKALYDGIRGYNEFLRMGGTYYGGPDPGMYQPVN